MKTNSRCIVAWMLAVCLLCAGLCAWAEEEFAVEGVARTADIPYLDDGEKDYLLDVYQPEGAAQPTPVIVEIHGGGFIGSSKETNTAHVFNLLDPETYPEVYILTTPTDELFYPMAVDFDAALTEKDIPHEYHVYEGTKNVLGHVFNVENVDFPESQQANADAIAYLDSLCAK